MAPVVDMLRRRARAVTPILGLVLALAAVGPGFAQTRPAPAASASPAAGLIDLNSASRDGLMELDGIGEVRADAIIRARPFKAKTELVERHIIPESLYDKIGDKVTARPMPVALPPRPTAAPPARH
jgi:competence protein ComEA